MKARIAHKIRRRYFLFPEMYSIEQIKEAHAILGEKIEAKEMDAWKKANGLDTRTETVTQVGVVGVKIKTEPDRILGTEGTSLDTLSMPDLKNLAHERGLKGYSRMRKADLVALLLSEEG